MSRRFQVLLALLLGAAVGAGVVSCTQQPSVQATAPGRPAPEPVQWEYKTVRITSDENVDVGKIDTKLNAVAAEGWEYNGSVVMGNVAVFRRPKK